MNPKIPWAKPVFPGREAEYLSDALGSTWISGGAYVERFERDLAQRLGIPHAISTSSGTTALHLALNAVGLGPGDEVILPAFTFVAPANMAMAVGATPVLADIDRETWCLDPSSVESAFTNRTKAIVGVHIYGNMCDMDALVRIANEKGVLLIEDVAQALFSTWRGRAAGTFGRAGCFSFQATKTITTGEGGCVVTGDQGLTHRMRLIRSHGMDTDRRYWHDVLGHNFRLTNLQAAVGCAQLEAADGLIADKLRVYRLYQERLGGVSGVTLQTIPAEAEPVIWAVAVLLDPDCWRLDRDGLIESLLAEGIETRPGFHSLTTMPLYRSTRSCEIAEAVAPNVLSVPSFSSLTENDIDEVCDRLLALRR